MLKTEVKVGVFVVIGALLLFYMTANIEKLNFGNKKGYSLFVLLNTAQGLVKNSHVKVSGVPIGRIKSIGLKGDFARVEITLPEDVKIQKGSVAYIKMESLLGEKFLNIVRDIKSKENVFLKEGDEIPQGGDAPDIDQLISKLNSAATNLKDLTGAFSGVLGGEDGKRTLKVIVSNIKTSTERLDNILASNQEDIRRIVANIDKFTRELPAMGSNVKGVLASVGSVSKKLEDGTGTLGKLINDDEIYNRADKVIENLSDITGKVSKGEGTLGKLVQNDEIYSDAKEVMNNIKDITDKLSKGESTIGKLLNDSKMYDETMIALATLNRVAMNLEKGEGTLGKLLNDPKVYDEAAAAVAGLNKIISKIEKGEGLLGKLVNDETLYVETGRALRGIARATEGIEEQVPITTLGVIIGTIIR
jgi:phospholipid/cholesterol/gamma-HCH transport system substrate-binding protein